MSLIPFLLLLLGRMLLSRASLNSSSNSSRREAGQTRGGRGGDVKYDTFTYLAYIHASLTIYIAHLYTLNPSYQFSGGPLPAFTSVPAFNINWILCRRPLSLNLHPFRSLKVTLFLLLLQIPMVLLQCIIVLSVSNFVFYFNSSKSSLFCHIITTYSMFFERLCTY